MADTYHGPSESDMDRVAKILSTSWSTLDDAHQALLDRGMSEYDIFLTIKAAALLHPHVQEVLDDLSPDTQRT